MEQKTKVTAEEGRQDMQITREFDLPVELVFRAYTEAEFVEQWMNTKVLKLESKKHGGYQFETSDPTGKFTFQASGVIHELAPDKKIVRTFEMSNTPFGVQMEIYNFEKISNSTSRLNMHVIYESGAQRDLVLKMPFAQGLSMAHDRIQALLAQSK